MPSLRKLVRWAIALAFVYAAYEIVPPYFGAFLFRDEIAQIAHQATVDTGEAARNPLLPRVGIEEGARDEVMLRARDHHIRLDPEHLQVMHDGIKVIIEANYTVHVDLLVRQYDLNFQVSSEPK